MAKWAKMYIYKLEEERVEYLRVSQLCSSTIILPMTSIINNSEIQRIKYFHASTNGIDRKPSKKLNKGNLAQKVSTLYSRGWRRFRKAVQTVFGIFHETHPLSDLFAAFQRRLLIETWCYMRYRLYGHDGRSRLVPYKGTVTKREREREKERNETHERGMMADAFPWDQPSFRFPRRRTALCNFFPWLAGFKPRDKNRFERLPFTSSIALFSRFSRSHWFFARADSPTRHRFAQNTPIRWTNATCVSRAASPADSLSLEFVYCPPPCVWFRFVVEPSVRLSLSIRVRFV